LNNKYKFQDINSYCKNIYRLAELADLKNYMNDFNKISLKDICREFVARAEKKLMKKVLKSTNWNRKKAADILNISYKSLLYKVKAYNLKPKPA
jgi:transcriptional regulator with PAS, ATPase and Fis domain